MTIINNNVQNVKFLRNGSVYGSHNAAYEALSGFTLTAEQDGTAILARYTAEDSKVKTLVGWVYSGESGSYITIQDVEGASGDVAALLGGGVTTANTVTMQLTALSGNNESSSADTSVEGAKRYADQILSDAIDSFEYTGVTTGDGKVVVNVTESDGVISGITAEVGGLKLTDYSKGSDSGAVATTDTINQAISKLENQVDAEADARAAAIEALDYTDTASAKTFVTSVSETDGVVSTTKGTITSSGKTIVLTDNADGGVNFEANVDGTTIIIDESTGTMSVSSAALVQYEGDGDTIQIGAVSEGVRTVSSPLTISATTPSEANVKEQYNLVGASGNTIGATIKIYKDSALLSVALLHADTTATPQVLPTYDKTNGWTDIDATAQTQANQALCYAYEDVEGTVVVAAVPVGSFINEQEFASGVTWDATENKVKGVVDTTSESFLTVGADGFKLSGVQDAIDTAVSGLDATVSAETAHVTVQIDEVDGKLTAVTLTESNVANANDLATLSGKTVTAITSTNGSITASIDDAVGNKTYDIQTDADKIQMSGFSAENTTALSGIAESDSIATAFEKTNAVITENEQVTSAALNDLEEKIEELSGSSVSGLTEEIASRQRVDGITGSAYTATAGANYISDATSLNDADQKLDAAINVVEGDLDVVETNYVSGMTVNGSALTKSDRVLAVTVTPATSATTATSTEAITVVTDANGNITLGLATIDCGTY